MSAWHAWGRLAVSAVLVWLCAAGQDLGAQASCQPVYDFDLSGEGWYYLEADGSKNYNLWRPDAGLGGTGALVMPTGVDVIYRDAGVDLPIRDICFAGKTDEFAVKRGGSGESSVATVWWLQHDQSAGCLDEGCYVTHFPARLPSSSLGSGFELYHYPVAMIQGPQCDQPEVAAIAVVHDRPFTIDDLGVLTGLTDLALTKDCQVVGGDLVQCTLTVSNVGAATVDAFEVTDLLAEGLSFQSGGGGDWRCSGPQPPAPPESVLCTYIGSPLEPGAVSHLNVSLVSSVQPKPENCAVVASANDSNPDNDRSCDSTDNVFTDRAAWEAAVGAIQCEAFENEPSQPGGSVPTPYTTVEATLLESLSAPEQVDIQVLDPGLVNGSRELHFRDFNRGVAVSQSSGFLAFGLDFETANETWVVEALGISTTLPALTNGFIGFVLGQQVPSFHLTGAEGPQGGISIDNLCRRASPDGTGCSQPIGAIFCDGFESGDVSSWVHAMQGPSNR